VKVYVGYGARAFCGEAPNWSWTLPPLMATVMLVRTAVGDVAYAVREKPELGFRVNVLMQA
jgi:hypothetical protein